MTVRDHKDLIVWKKSLELSKAIYKCTSIFPKEEVYTLVSQMRRAAISVPSNIAEGAARNTTKEFINFLYISLGSLAELDTQLILATELGYFTANDEVQQNISSIKRMLCSLISKLKNKNNK